MLPEPLIWTLAAILSVTGVALAALYYDYRYREQWFGYMYGYPLEGFDRQVFLTYDDGPSGFGKLARLDEDSRPVEDPVLRSAILAEIPTYDFRKSATENLLDLLALHDAKAIFFVCGKAVEHSADAARVLRRIVDEGHLVGNHSFSHDYSTRIPRQRMHDDFARSQEVIGSITGARPSLFRPPFGDWKAQLTIDFLKDARLSHYAFPVFWTNLFKDWALSKPAELANLDSHLAGFRTACRQGRGRIALLHDTYLASIVLTARLIDEAPRLGYRLGSPRDLERAASAETARFRLAPFVYHLRNVVRRLEARIGRRESARTNYEM